MASILDAGLASVFSAIFIFLLVYALVYGVLAWRKPFGDKATGIYGIASFVIAMICAITPSVRNFISFVTPWYIALFVVIFFILFIVSMFGLNAEHDFSKIIVQPKAYVWIIIFAVIILLFGLGFTLGPSLTPGGAQAAAQPAAPVAAGTPVIGQPGSVPYAEPGTLAPGPYPAGGQYAAGATAGQPGSTATSDFSTNLFNTLFHPKVLGMIVTLLIAAVAVFFLSSPSGGDSGHGGGGGHH